MTQLIINGTTYPEAPPDKYKCYLKDVGEQIRMINGRLVTELSAQKVIIEYEEDYFPNALLQTCLSDLNGATDLTVQYLDPQTDTMLTDAFKCTKKPVPVFNFALNGAPTWHKIAFTLESVEGV